MNLVARTLDRRVREIACCAVALSACLVLQGCESKSGDSGVSTAPSALAAGDRGQDPATGLSFVVDANRGGQAREIHLVRAAYGRLVEVQDFDPATGESVLQLRELLIGEEVASDSVDFLLERDALTDVERLTILHRADSAEYQSAFLRIENSAPVVEVQGTNPPAMAALSAIPRDAALLLSFDDLLDARTITAQNVQLLVGDPPLRLQRARVAADSSHGDLLDADGDGVPEFHTTRVVVDPCISALEAAQSDPPLAESSSGLPESLSADLPNVLLRLPTQAAAAIGQLEVLTNLSGRGLAIIRGEPSDPKSVTLDIVRSLRAASAELGDPNNGYLIQVAAPSVVGVQAVQLLNVVPAGGRKFTIDAQFAVTSCTPQPQVGDAIRIGNSVVAFVTQLGAPPSGGLISNVQVVVDVGLPANFVPGPAEYLMRWDPSQGLLPDCFVRFNPPPTSPPSQGIAPNSTITIRFSTPMDLRSVTGMDTFVVNRVSNANPLNPLMNKIVATIQPSADAKEFTYKPALPFDRNPSPLTGFPLGESYRLELAGGANGVVGFSGQPLANALPPFQFRLDPAAAAVGSKGFVFDFNSTDQDQNGAPELRGQFLFDLTQGAIRPRPVTRFSSVADSSQPVIGLMVPFTAPIHPPLSNLGSKVMTVYRYHDLGLGLLDDSTLNLDVEGLAWAPLGAPQVDQFSQFRMAFCHSKFLPDEVIDQQTLLPQFPNSGLVRTFDLNQADPVRDPLRVVHAKEKGYSVQPVDAFTASTGTVMMPYPLNRGVPTSQFARYTFRDTGLLAVGGPSGSGVDTSIDAFALGIPKVTSYGVGKVPSLGLPLLMEFRCYPDAAAFGLNGFKVNIALNSSARPAFRAYSSGGVLANGALHTVNPDNEPNATGGINSSGLPTGVGSEIDPVFYLGQVDFVVRVNRVHSIWLDTLQPQARFQSAISEPAKALQPAGTETVVALRGAVNLTNGTPVTGGVLPSRDASRYDPYGDALASVLVPPAPFVNWTVTYPLGSGGLPDKTWKNDVGAFNNQPGGFAPRFVQMRITMFSNPVNANSPTLTAVGIPFQY